MMTAQMTAQGINDVAAGSSDISIQVQEIINSINFGMIGTCFVLYFIGGYLLYAALFAAIRRSEQQGRHSAVHDSDYAFDGVQLVCRNL